MRLMTIKIGSKAKIIMSNQPFASDLDEFILEMKSRKTDAVVVLLEDFELDYHFTISGINLIKEYQKFIPDVIHYPIKDYGAPTDFDKFHSFIKKILFFLHNHKTVWIHCAGGNGRTGLVVASILMNLRKEDSVNKIIKYVRDCRPKAIESSTQVRFLIDYKKKYIF